MVARGLNGEGSQKGKGLFGWVRGNSSKGKGSSTKGDHPVQVGSLAVHGGIKIAGAEGGRSVCIGNTDFHLAPGETFEHDDSFYGAPMITNSRENVEHDGIDSLASSPTGPVSPTGSIDLASPLGPMSPVRWSNDVHPENLFVSDGTSKEELRMIQQAMRESRQHQASNANYAAVHDWDSSESSPRHSTSSYGSQGNSEKHFQDFDLPEGFSHEYSHQSGHSDHESGHQPGKPDTDHSNEEQVSHYSQESSDDFPILSYQNKREQLDKLIEEHER